MQWIVPFTGLVNDETTAHTVRKELTMSTLKQKYIGDKNFYKRVLMLALPIMIQSGITNFVGLLDNIMVGRVGTDQMSGVAIANQLIFVFNLAIFGAISGAGIFGAQFFGRGNNEGVRYAFRFKLMVCAVFTVLAIVIFIIFGEPLLSAFINNESEVGDPVKTLYYGKQYLTIMLIGLIPFAIKESYAGTLKETGETVVPMLSGIAAVVVNLIFNTILIFGYLGAPKLGVVGAAIATVLSRFVELGIVVWWTHRHKERNPFIVGALRSLYIPKHLVKQMIIKGLPLTINETLWAGGTSMMLQAYSLRGLQVVAAYNISSTVSNLFNVVFLSLGSAIGILVGQLLGANKLEEAVEQDRKMIVFSVFSCFIVGTVMAVIAPLFPMIYKTEDAVRELARNFLFVSAAFMPVYAFSHASYFTMRSGGKTFVTFLFDSCFVWTVSVPLAYCLSRFTDLPIIPLFIICQMTEFVKCTIGYILLKKKVWVQNIVMDSKKVVE